MSMRAEIDHLAAAIPHASWFAALGTALEPSERADLEFHARGLGLAPASPALVVDWAEAARVAADPAWDARWWDAEEKLRGALLAEAELRTGKVEAIARLSEVTMAAYDATIGAAAMAAAASGVADQALVRVASGAATQACYQCALAILAGVVASEHPFHAKLRLFQAGRWPLGIVRGSAYIF
jgi:hypothetical protein